MRPRTFGQINAAQRALVRAYADKCHARLSNVEGHGPHHTLAVYTNEVGERYHVLLDGCTCPAGRNGYICKHSVALADLTGQLDLLIPHAYSTPVKQTA